MAASKTLALLLERNARQTAPFVNIFAHHHALFLKTQQLERDMKSRPVHAAAPSAAAEDPVQVAKMKEELTMCYKRMSEHASQVIELNGQLKATQERVKTKEEELAEARKAIKSLEDRLSKEKTALESTQEDVKVLAEELRALQRELRKIEAERDKVSQEYSGLLERWLKRKEEEAEALNAENSATLAAIAASRAEAIQKAAAANQADPSKAQEDLLDQLMKQRGGPSAVVALPKSIKRSFAAHKAEVTCVAYGSPSLVATGSSDKTVHLWDARSGHSMSTISGAGSAITCVAFSIGGESVLAASNDNATRVWSVSGQRLRHTLTGHTAKVAAATFSSDGQRVFSGSHDRTIKVWDLAKGYCVKTVLCFSSCNDVVSTVDGTTAISAHLDASLRVWDLRSGQQIHDVPTIHSKQITSLALHPVTGASVLTCARDNTLRLIDLNNYSVVQTFKDDNYRSGLNWSRACFSPDGTHVAAGGADGQVFLWNVESGKVVGLLSGGHKASVACCAWNPNGAQLASVDNTGTLTLWEP